MSSLALLPVEIVFFLSTFVKNIFMRIQKNDYNSVFFYNILCKYKNIFNNNKLLKLICIKKGKYYNKLKTFITKNIYKYLYS